MPTNNKQKEHYMLKEIYEQPDVIKNIIRNHVDFSRGSAVFEEFKDKFREVKEVRRVIFIGCGTSYHAGVYGNYIFEELAGLNSETELAEEFIARDPVIEGRTAVIALSQSGETGDILKAVRVAREKGAFVIGITNGHNSTLVKLSDAVVYLEAGEEKAMAATKTFTAELITLALLAIYFGGLHRNPPTISQQAAHDLKVFSQSIARTLELEKGIKMLARDYLEEKGYIILGEKYNYPIALEAALKLKETTYVHAEGMAAGEFMHGPKAILEKGFPVIFLSPIDSVYEKNLEVIKEAKKLGAYVIVLTTTGNYKLNKLADDLIYISSPLEIFTPILSVIPFQLLAYHMAVLKNIDVDKPRNLEKFVG